MPLCARARGWRPTLPARGAVGRAGRTCGVRDAPGTPGAGPGGGRMLYVFPSSPTPPHSPRAGMKQPHLEIPSLLKAGSARQRAPSGKPRHYAVSKQPGGAPELGRAWRGGAQPRFGASSFCPPYSHGTQTLAAPQAGREPGQCRMQPPGPGTARCPRCSWRRGPGGARRARLSAAPAAESPRARWHRRVHPQDTLGTVALGPCQLLLDKAAWGGQGRGSAGLGEEGVPPAQPHPGTFWGVRLGVLLPKALQGQGEG